MKPKFDKGGNCSCGHAPQPNLVPPGYSVRKDGTTACIDCTAERYQDEMKREGAGKLALIGDQLVGPVPSISFPISDRKEATHNIGGQRLDFWFIGPDEMRWQGTQIGGPGKPVTVKRCAGIDHLRDQLQAVGITIYLKDGEYKVNYRYGSPDTAYYTTDPVDAYRTGLKMAEDRDKPQPVNLDAWA